MWKGARGYLAFILLCGAVAIAAWTYLRPAYPHLPENLHKKAEENEYTPGGPACLPSRIKTLPDGEAADERYRCEAQAEIQRLQSDDLVQQTRAADAAAAAVGIAYRQTLIELAGGIVGLLTLLAAAYAAWYARRAAEAGAAANEIAESSHRQALKPYLAVSKASFIIDENYQPIAQLELKNFGQSPAIDVQTWFSIWVESFPLNSGLPSAPDDLPKGQNIIGPGGTSDIYHPRGTGLNAFEKSEILAGRAALYVFGESGYRDIFGNHFISKFILFASGSDAMKLRRLAPYIEGNMIVQKGEGQ